MKRLAVALAAVAALIIGIGVLVGGEPDPYAHLRLSMRQQIPGALGFEHEPPPGEARAELTPAEVRIRYPADGGEVRVAFASIRDTSTLYVAERMKARHAAVVESSSAAILVTDLDGRIRIWNRGAEKLYGYSAAEMIGRPFDTLIPAELPDKFVHLKQRLLKEESIVDYETVRLDRDGNRIDVAGQNALLAPKVETPPETDSGEVLSEVESETVA